VRTGIDTITETSAKVAFEIFKKENKKICAEGKFEFTLFSLSNGKVQKIPKAIIDHDNF
jgi:acyl-CoA thioester hydrolase/thioesterase-3